MSVAVPSIQIFYSRLDMPHNSPDYRQMPTKAVNQLVTTSPTYNFINRLLRSSTVLPITPLTPFSTLPTSPPLAHRPRSRISGVVDQCHKASGGPGDPCHSLRRKLYRSVIEKNVRCEAVSEVVHRPFLDTNDGTSTSITSDLGGCGKCSLYLILTTE